MSFIGWLDHSESEQRQVRELLQMFSDKGTVDDLGIGTVRDSISNRLFPGTSVIQTRARYFLFVPWIFQRAELRHPTKLLARADGMERWLIEALRAGGDHEGLIGRQAGKDVRTLPSAIYWSGLAAYGIFLQPGITRAQYARAARTARTTNVHEEELADRSASYWHRGVPPAPDEFFDFAAADFRLTDEESNWLSERVLSTEPFRGPNLLGGYVRDLSAAPTQLATSFWGGPLPEGTADNIVSLVHHAERFSATVESAALVYNLMLCEQRNDESRGDEVQAAVLRSRLDEWAEDARRMTLAEWAQDLSPFWAQVAERSRVPRLTKHFVDEWTALLSVSSLASLADDPRARVLVRNRELQHKRVQARFANPARLRDWNGASGLAPLDYRWTQVQRFLNDLSAGRHQSVTTAVGASDVAH